MIHENFRKIFFNYLKDNKQLAERKDILPSVEEVGYDNFDIEQEISDLNEITTIQTFGDLVIFVVSYNNFSKSALIFYDKHFKNIKIIKNFKEGETEKELPLIISFFIDKNKYMNIIYKNENNEYYFAAFNDILNNLDLNEYFFIQNIKLEFGELNQYGKFFISENKDADNSKYVLIYNKSGDTGAPDYQATFNFILFRIEEKNAVRINENFIFPQQEIGNNFGLHKLNFVIKNSNDREKIFLTWNTKDENDDLVDVDIKSGWRSIMPDDLINAKKFYQNITNDKLASSLKILVKNKNTEYDLTETFSDFDVEVKKLSVPDGNTGYPGYWQQVKLYCKTTWKVGSVIILENTNMERYTYLGNVPPTDNRYVRTPIDISVSFVYKVLTNAEPELIYTVSTINNNSIEQNEVITKWNKNTILNVGDIEIIENQFISSILLKSNSKWDLISINMFNNQDALLNVSNFLDTPQEIGLVKNIDFITNISDSLFAFMNYQNNLLLGNIYRKKINENFQNWNPNSFKTPWTLAKNSLNGIWSWAIRENNLLIYFIYNKNLKQIMSFTISYTNNGKESDPYFFEPVDNQQLLLNLTRLKAYQKNFYENPKEDLFLNYDNSWTSKTRNANIFVLSTSINQYNLNSEKAEVTDFHLATNANYDFLSFNDTINKDKRIFLNANVNLYFRQWQERQMLTNQSITFATTFENYSEDMVLQYLELILEDESGEYSEKIDIKDYLIIEFNETDNRTKMYLRISIYAKNGEIIKSFNVLNKKEEIVYNKSINFENNLLDLEIEFDIIDSEENLSGRN